MNSRSVPSIMMCFIFWSITTGWTRRASRKYATAAAWMLLRELLPIWESIIRKNSNWLMWRICSVIPMHIYPECFRNMQMSILRHTCRIFAWPTLTENYWIQTRRSARSHWTTDSAAAAHLQGNFRSVTAFCRVNSTKQIKNKKRWKICIWTNFWRLHNS